MPFLDLATRLDANDQEPLALQLVRLLAREILDGRIPPGASMPSSRTLAEELGVSRHVAMSALRELELEGWAQSRPGSGTYVVDAPPSALPKSWGQLPERAPMPEAPPFELSSQLQPVSTMASSMLDLSDGFPDARLAPKEALARGYRRALQRHGDDLLGLGETRGNRSLREVLAQYLSESRGLRITASNLLITRGTPMSLSLLASALGGEVAVEDPGDPSAWEALRTPGGHLYPVTVDHDGFVPEALEALLDRQTINLFHLTPQRQFPTTVALSVERRSRLMKLARQHSFALLEVDPDLEFTWDGPPHLPLAADDPDGRVIHIGSLSHLLAPGLGLAYLVAPSALVDRLARLRQRLDLQGDRVLEWAVADLIRDGDLERHLARARKIYRERRDTFTETLRLELGSKFGESFEALLPEGGLACWVSLPRDFDASKWCEACLWAGVKIHPGRRFDFRGEPLPGLRLGFAHLEPDEAQKALGILGRELAKALHG